MMQKISYIAVAAVLATLGCAAPAAAGDQARAIINSLDPKSLNELFAALPAQPDAALTNIIPVTPNKFRFLFVWPGSNPLMTYDRVGRSFAERFAAFAGQLKPLATGYCLTSQNLFFGTSTYGEDEVNIAYRDIEVRYQFGWQPPCQGRYFNAEEAQHLGARPAHHGGYGAALPDLPAPAPAPHPALPAEQPSTPEDRLKPFLNAPAVTPPLE